MHIRCVVLCLAHTKWSLHNRHGWLSAGVPADIVLFSPLFWLTWKSEFCSLVFTISTNIRLFNTERIVTQFSLCSSLTLASKQNGPFFSTFRCHPFGWNAGPFWSWGVPVRMWVCRGGPGFLAMLCCPAEPLRGLCSRDQRNLRGGGWSPEGPSRDTLGSSWRDRSAYAGSRASQVCGRGCRPPVGSRPGLPGPGHDESHEH